LIELNQKEHKGEYVKMRQVLYVIDRTSRQHGYEIPEEGLKVKIEDNEYTITKENPQIEIFFDAIRSKTPFIIYGKRNVSVYNSETITGIQYSPE
jgi:hypothetical protein